MEMEAMGWTWVVRHPPSNSSLTCISAVCNEGGGRSLVLAVVNAQPISWRNSPGKSGMADSSNAPRPILQRRLQDASQGYFNDCHGPCGERRCLVLRSPSPPVQRRPTQGAVHLFALLAQHRRPVTHQVGRDRKRWAKMVHQTTMTERISN